jgi:hypothetical protein
VYQQRGGRDHEYEDRRGDHDHERRRERD